VHALRIQVLEQAGGALGVLEPHQVARRPRPLQQPLLSALGGAPGRDHGAPGDRHLGRDLGLQLGERHLGEPGGRLGLPDLTLLLVEDGSGTLRPTVPVVA